VVDPGSGVITVGAANDDGAPALDFEDPQCSAFALAVTVTDTGQLSDTANVSVVVIDVNEPPTLADTARSVEENSAVGTLIGAALVASDEDNSNSVWQALTYSVTLGNSGGLFALASLSNGGGEPTTFGQLSVATAALNFEDVNTYPLTVTVTDDGSPPLSDSAAVVINVLDVNEAPVIEDAAREIEENSPVNALVGDVVTGTDVDQGQVLSYRILAGNEDGIFGINTCTGQISVKLELLDFETRSTYVLTVEAEDDGSPRLSDTAFVTVSVLDMNEPPVMADVAVDVEENSAAGTAVAAMVSTDVDAGQAAAHVFAITSGNDDGVFAIDAATGAVTVSDPVLNFEALGAYSLGVSVTDNGALPTRELDQPALSASAVLSITLLDVNENPVVPPATRTVPENSLAATALTGGAVVGSDVDAGQTLTYTLTGGDGIGVFAIDSATGVISVVQEVLDFETKNEYTVSVTATDDGEGALTGTGLVTIQLEDVNEPPTIDDTARSLDENTAAGYLIGAPVVGSDVDAGQSLTYTIESGNGQSFFAIDPATGQLSVGAAAALNYETASAHTLTVMATDNGLGGLTDSASVVVSVNDVNEAPAIADASRTVLENSGAAATVDGGVVTGTDQDAADGLGASLAYSITGGTGAALFAVHASSGALTVVAAGSLNFEATAAYTVLVTATDTGWDGDDALASTAVVTISLVDLNEAPAMPGASRSIGENAAAGDAVGAPLSAEAFDVDAGGIHDGALVYTMVNSGAHDAFVVESGTGQIRMQQGTCGDACEGGRIMDVNVVTLYTLTVRVADPHGLTATGSVTVEVFDQNNPPTIDDRSFTLTENRPVGFVFGAAVTGTDDPDSSANGGDGEQTLAYSISSGNEGDVFQIDAASGQMSVKTAALDFEGRNEYFIVVEATDDGHGLLSDTCVVTVALTDENEAPVLCDSSGIGQACQLVVEENSDAGTAVGAALLGTDQDAGDAAVLVYR